MVEEAERVQLAKVLRKVAIRLGKQCGEEDEDEALQMAKRYVKNMVNRVDLEEILSLPLDGRTTAASSSKKDEKINKKRAAAAAAKAAAEWVRVKRGKPAM
jgi:hypothetical protein